MVQGRTSRLDVSRGCIVAKAVCYAIPRVAQRSAENGHFRRLATDFRAGRRAESRGALPLPGTALNAQLPETGRDHGLFADEAEERHCERRTAPEVAFDHG